jgi:serine/threonine protein kinase
MSLLTTDFNAEAKQAHLQLRIPEGERRGLSALWPVASNRPLIGQTVQIVHSIKRTIWGQICIGQLNGERVAVKFSTIRDERPRDDELEWSCEDSVEEASILKEIPIHPHIARYIDHFKVSEHLSCKMDVNVLLQEYMPGGDLFDHLEANGRMSESIAKSYFIQVLSALKHIHNHGFCHLDLSLENILLSEDRKLVKLCDFGQAKRISSPSLDKTWKYRRGKKKFMAPEVVTLEESICGASCDLYSLGVVLFCILTGFHPYVEPDTSDLGFSLLMDGQIEILLEVDQLKYCTCASTCTKKTEHIISRPALEMMTGLVCSRERRLTMEAIEAHPWIQPI